jgi:protein-tyrosine phosphatase
MAEAVFRHQAALRGVLEGFNIDSAGTGGWHAGADPDERMQATARRNGITLQGSARQVVAADFSEFDVIICMDGDNYSNLMSMGAPPARVKMMLEYHPDSRQRDVPDPYYGGSDGFQEVFDLLECSCSSLLDEMLPEAS